MRRRHASFIHDKGAGRDGMGWDRTEWLVRILCASLFIELHCTSLTIEGGWALAIVYHLTRRQAHRLCKRPANGFDSIRPDQTESNYHWGRVGSGRDNCSPNTCFHNILQCSALTCEFSRFSTARYLLRYPSIYTLRLNGGGLTSIRMISTW